MRNENSSYGEDNKRQNTIKIDIGIIEPIDPIEQSRQTEPSNQLKNPIKSRMYCTHENDNYSCEYI